MSGMMRLHTSLQAFQSILLIQNWEILVDLQLGI